LPAPPSKGTERAFSTQVREDQRAIDTLRGRELVLVEALEAREPFLAEAVARGESVRCEITESMVVGVDARDRGRDRIERVAPVDKIVGVLAEARELERLPAVGAELRIVRVRPSTVAAVDGRAGSGGRRGGRRPGRDGGGFVVLGLVTEASHAFAQLAENVGQLPRPEDD
jgi:hypothetical protein